LPLIEVAQVVGNSTVAGGQTYSGTVPPAQMPLAVILSGLGFMHELEQFVSANLTAVTAFRVEGVSPPGPGQYVPTVRLDESSFVDLTEQAAGGSLTWTAPAGDSEWRIFTFWERFTNQRSNTGGTHPTSFIGNGSWTTDHFSKTGAALSTNFFDEYVIADAETEALLRDAANYGNPIIQASWYR